MKILFTQEEIKNRVAQIGNEITEYYRDKSLTVVVLATGGIVFAADLVRCIDLPLFMECICCSSYQGQHTSGLLKLRSSLKCQIKGRHVLLVDEVLDSGVTLSYMSKFLLDEGALSVKSAVAVSKNTPRSADLEADWSCFKLASGFLIGYGMDDDELYRNLPYIAEI